MIAQLAKKSAEQNGSHPRMVEIAPNRFVRTDHGRKDDLPEVLLSDLVDLGNGTFKLVPRSWEKLAHLTPELSELLGMSRNTRPLRHLIRAKFVDGARTAPGCYSINVGSFFRHMKRCAENADFWEDPRVMRQYRDAY